MALRYELSSLGWKLVIAVEALVAPCSLADELAALGLGFLNTGSVSLESFSGNSSQGFFTLVISKVISDDFHTTSHSLKLY